MRKATYARSKGLARFRGDEVRSDNKRMCRPPLPARDQTLMAKQARIFSCEPRTLQIWPAPPPLERLLLYFLSGHAWASVAGLILVTGTGAIPPLGLTPCVGL